MSVYYNLSSTTKLDDAIERPLTITNFSTKKTINNMSDYSVGVKRFKIPVETVPFFRIYENRFHMGYSSSNNAPYFTDTDLNVINQPIDVFGKFKDGITNENAFQPFTSGVYNDFYRDTLYKELLTTDTDDTTIGNRFLPIKDDNEFCAVMTRALNHSLYAGIPAKFNDTLGYTMRNQSTQLTDILTTSANLGNGAGWFAINTLPQSATETNNNVIDYKISITDFVGTDNCKISDLAFRLKFRYSTANAIYVDLGGGYFKDGAKTFDIPADFGFTPDNVSRVRGDGFINWSPYARYSSNYLKGDALKRGFNKPGICVYPASNDDLDNMLGRNSFGNSNTVNQGTVVLEARVLTPASSLLEASGTKLYSIASCITIWGATTYQVLRQNSSSYRAQIYSSPRFNFNQTNQKIELRSHAINNDETAVAVISADTNSNLFDSRADLFMNNRLLNVLGFKTTSNVNTVSHYNSLFISPPKNTTPNASIDFGGMVELESIFSTCL